MINHELLLKNHVISNYRLVYSFNGEPFDRIFQNIEQVINEYNLLDSSEKHYDYAYVERVTNIYEIIKIKN